MLARRIKIEAKPVPKPRRRNGTLEAGHDTCPRPSQAARETLATGPARAVPADEDVCVPFRAMAEFRPRSPGPFPCKAHFPSLAPSGDLPSLSPSARSRVLRMGEADWRGLCHIRVAGHRRDRVSPGRWDLWARSPREDGAGLQDSLRAVYSRRSPAAGVARSRAGRTPGRSNRSSTKRTSLAGA